MASKRGLTYKIRDFLLHRGWKEIDNSDSYRLKVAYDNESNKIELTIPFDRRPTDYCDAMENVLKIISQIYENEKNVLQFDEYRIELDNTRLKYRKDGNWIKKESETLIDPMAISDPCLPRFDKFSLSLLGEESQ